MEITAKVKRRYVPYKYSEHWNKVEENNKIRFINMMYLLISIKYITF